MANFPQTPTNGDTHQIGDKIWTWDGEKWFADYDALSPVFQAISAQGMVDRDAGTAFELAVDPDILSELNLAVTNTIGNVTVTGDNSPVVGSTKIYSFDIDGDVSDEIGTFTCDVPDAIVQLNQIQFPTIGTGKVYVEVNSATATDSPVNAEMDITVVAVPDTIGTITITGNDTPDKMDTVTYGYTIDGTATNDSAVMTAVGAGASVSGNDVTWTGSGQGEVRFEVSAPGASDDPKSAVLDVNVTFKSTIGNITLTGNANPAEGTTEIYNASIDGDASSLNAQWTADPALGATQNPIIPNSFDFTGANVGATGDITVTYTSLASWDSPKSESFSVTVAAAPITNPFPITGSTPNYTNTGTNVNTPDPVLYSCGTDGLGQTWSVEQNTQSLTFRTSGDASDLDIVNDYAMFDGSETRPTTFDFNYSPANNSPLTITVNPAAFPAGTYKLEVLIQETTGEKIGLNVNNHSGVTFTNFSPQICTTPTWIESSQAIEWNTSDWDGSLIMVNETSNAYVNIYAFKALGQIVTFGRAVQINTYSDTSNANYRFFNPGNYKVKCDLTDNGIDYNNEFDVVVSGYLPLMPTTPRTDLLVETEYDVKVVGGVYELDGASQPTLQMVPGQPYTFFSGDSSAYAVRPIRIYTDSTKATEITDNVVIRDGQGTTTWLPTTPGTYSYQNEHSPDMGGDIVVSATTSFTTTTYDVTVVSTSYGNKYEIDGVQQDSLTLTAGNTYIFDQSDSSNSGHPLRIYTDSSKTTEVTAGVTVGSDSTTFVPGSTGTYSYQCSAHAGMGGSITVQ